MLFHSHLISVVLAAVASSVTALTLPVYQQQLPLGVPDPDARTRQDAASRSAAATGAAVASASGSRKLHGRFLHITDIHPDPHYKPGASISSACHRNRPRKQKKRAGSWGAPYNECDAPMNLVGRTFRWLETHWADEIDFVVWTGDNARHDNDRNVPRTLREIYDLNKDIAQRMQAVFGRRGIPVVPSLGNNDVWPHNILSGGPNDIISRFSSIWSSFIPFPSYQVFQRGAYYSVEVVPNHIAVVALNTMFFYDSNKAVGGCELRDRDDPGNLQMDWLEVQLRTFRDRGMHVWLTGHVPPSSGNYFPECHVRYAELSLRYQDTILGHLFGHMNNDHFYFLEAIDVEFPPKDSDANISSDTDAGTLAHDGLYDELMDDFTALSKVAKRRSEDDYAAVNVAPSVVPNPYIPSFRVFSYNVTEVSGLSISALVDRNDLKRQRGNLSRDGGEGVMGDGDVNDQKKKKKKKKHGGDRSPGHHRGGVKKGDRFKTCEGEEAKQESWRCHLTDEWHSDADAPCRSNRLWTPLGYAQYHIPPSRLANADVKPKFKLQYLTYPLGALHPPEPPSLEANADVDGKKGKGKDKFAYPVPPRNLPKSLRTPPLNRTQSKYAPYGMDDLTVGSWLALADKLGGSGDSKLKKRFRRYMYGMVKEKVDEVEEEEELVG